MPTRIDWSGAPEMKARMMSYGRAVKQAELALAQYYAAVIQTAARERAPWTDRTGNARAALRAYTSEDVPTKHSQGLHDYPSPNDLARDTVALYLAHGMDYGVQLETKYQGRYAIIIPTLQRFYPEISQQLKAIFGR